MRATTPRRFLVPCIVSLLAIGSEPMRAVAQEREPISLLLLDPGHMPEGGRAVARADSVRLKLPSEGAKPPNYQFFALPAEGFSTVTTTSAQLRLRSAQLITLGQDFVVGFTSFASYARVDQHPGTRDGEQFGVGLDHVFGSAVSPGVALSVRGVYSNTQGLSKDAKAAGELDIPLDHFTLGAVAYYDKVTLNDGTTLTGGSGGAVATWTPREGSQFATEYDFKSAVNSEDSFAAKLTQSIGMWSSHPVAFSIGAGKHRAITSALTIALN